MSIKIGPVYRRGLRVAFIWWPLATVTERYSLLDKLIENQTIVAETVMWLGPILRGIGAALPACTLAILLVGPGPAFADSNTKEMDYWIEVAREVRKKIKENEARTAESQDTTPQTSASFKPDGGWHTLQGGQTMAGHRYLIELSSERHNLRDLLTSTGQCRSYSRSVDTPDGPQEVSYLFCHAQIVINHTNPVTVWNDAPDEKLILINPEIPYRRDAWVSQLRFVLTADSAGPIVIKSAFNKSYAIPKVQAVVTDLTAIQEEEEALQRTIAKEAEQKRLAAEREQAERQRIEAEKQRKLEEEKRQAALERQREEERRRKRAELERMQAPAPAPALDPERDPVNLTGKWALKDDSDTIVRIDHDIKERRVQIVTVQFSDAHIKREGQTHSTLTYRIDPDAPDTFAGDLIIHNTKEYRTACPAHPGAVRVPAAYAVIDARTIISRYTSILYLVEEDETFTCAVKNGEEITREWVRLGGFWQWWYHDFHAWKFFPLSLSAIGLLIFALRVPAVVTATIRAYEADIRKEEAQLINDNLNKLDEKGI